MSDKKKIEQIKPNIHPRNKNKGRYDFEALIKSKPKLKSFIGLNKYGTESINFSNPEAVKCLNQALLAHHYGVTKWDVPEGYLCAPVPGRADYIHHIADLLKNNNFGDIPTGDKVTCVDIGVGSNCIYPIIGTKEYGWKFIGADVDKIALKNARRIVDNNPLLKQKVQLKLQADANDFFYSIIKKEDKIDITICNPPFHGSAEEALKGTARKIKNLTGKKAVEPKSNFAGTNNELWCEGGELRFVTNMMKQSRKFRENCFWFTSLVSKQNNVGKLKNVLKSLGARDIVEIPMGQGNKTSRVLAWTFLNTHDQRAWKLTRWQETK